MATNPEITSSDRSGRTCHSVAVDPCPATRGGNERVGNRAPGAICGRPWLRTTSLSATGSSSWGTYRQARKASMPSAGRCWWSTADMASRSWVASSSVVRSATWLMVVDVVEEGVRGLALGVLADAQAGDVEESQELLLVRIRGHGPQLVRIAVQHRDGLLPAWPSSARASACRSTRADAIAQGLVPARPGAASTRAAMRSAASDSSSSSVLLRASPNAASAIKVARATSRVPRWSTGRRHRPGADSRTSGAR